MPKDLAIIREVYEHEYSAEEFEVELDRALETQAGTIVVEPARLGEDTARWITCGNCLHKTAVLSGASCLICAGVWPEKGWLFLPLGFTSAVCAGVYAVSWQFDPCCKYQVEYDLMKVPKLPLHSLTTTTPVVLVRKDDLRRKVLQNVLALTAASVCFYKIYRWYL
ncbi:transmembrane protein 11, mitochondrial [Plakobranchus ocellatus]|uniref:Transmembrane protein 11, mitochondrial n=1 Tax=Plakobranchus ocellatus TaxID=259542 RepID=A0AAV4DC46_9GAST|nr:transmembrane protein 11, mitochondrial [Plakobranchus ocellatus]